MSRRVASRIVTIKLVILVVIVLLFLFICFIRTDKILKTCCDLPATSHDRILQSVSDQP